MASDLRFRFHFITHPLAGLGSNGGFYRAMLHATSVLTLVAAVLTVLGGARGSRRRAASPSTAL